MSQRIEDYGFIADMRTVALVGRDGSMDWLCLPRIDSPACFAALLGTEEHGRWRLAPRGAAARVSRRYRRNSLVLETSFELPEGAITLVDFLTPAQVGEGLNVVRIVRGDRGRVDVEMELILRFEYGAFVPWVRRHPFGLTAIAGPDAIAIRTPVELTGRDYRTYASFCVGEGETVPFVMTWHQSHLPPPPPSDALDLMVRTEEWWLQWS
ncbi:MAG: glycoside hydrolase family 15 protein, partial [Dehalococcoidia bacterium]|nr:glycoside hydrolase family 15 protein [Dehalococcoidia bacterium]